MCCALCVHRGVASPLVELCWAMLGDGAGRRRPAASRIRRRMNWRWHRLIELKKGFRTRCQLAGLVLCATRTVLVLSHRTCFAYTPPAHAQTSNLAIVADTAANKARDTALESLNYTLCESKSTRPCAASCCANAGTHRLNAKASPTKVALPAQYCTVCSKPGCF